MNLTAEQINELTVLRNTARTAGKNNSSNTLYADAYELALEYFSTEDNDPLDSVDVSSWLWLEGAIDINRGDGRYSEFIRDYTETQYEERTGESFPQGADQIASNTIADIVITYIIENGTLPDVDTLAGLDAEGFTESLSKIDVAAWSGNLLFLNLNHTASFNKNLLEMEGDTYDTLLAFQAFTINGASFNDFSNSIGFALDSVFRVELTRGLFLDNVTSATKFLNKSYGDFADFSLTPRLDIVFADYTFGTTGDDVELRSDNTGLEQTEILHAGTGNDRIIGNINQSEIIDGGQGSDVLDYSEVTEKLTITIDQPEQPTTATYVGTVDDTGATGLFDIDRVFNVETLIGSSNDDTIIIEDIKDGLLIDGGEGTKDVLDFSQLDIGITIDLSQNIVTAEGKTFSFQNIEEFNGTSQNDTVIGGGQIDTLIAGEGADIFIAKY